MRRDLSCAAIGLVLLFAASASSAPETPGDFPQEARRLLQLRDWEKALILASRQLLEAPGDAQARTVRANAFLELGLFSNAMEDLNWLFDVKGDRSALHYCLRGAAWKGLGRYDRARTDLEEVLKQESGNPLALRYRGELLLAQGKHQEALEDFEHALRLSSGWEDPQTQLDRAAVLLLMNRGMDAAAEAGTLIDSRGWKSPLGPWGVIYANLGYRMAGKHAEARRILDEANRLGLPDFWPAPIIRYLRGQMDKDKLLFHAGDIRAMTAVRTVLGLDLALSALPSEALPYLSWVRDQGDRGALEYQLALAWIGRVEAAVTSEQPSP